MPTQSVDTLPAEQTGRSISPEVTAGKPESNPVTCQLLAPEEYADWDELVDKSVHGTVFHASWWLKATAQQLEILGLRDAKGRLVAGLPLPHKTPGLLRLYHSPQLTPYLGPVFDLTGIKNNYDQLHAMRSQGEALARGLPAFDSFRYVAGASAPDLQGFLWAGFGVGLAYTFRFLAADSLEEIQSAMSRTHAQKLTKAKRLGLTVEKEESIDELIRLNEMIFARQGRKPPYGPELIRRLWNEANTRKRASLYIARTAEGRPAAALFTVHDSRTTFQIVSGVDTSLPDVPGGNLVLWAAVQGAVEAGRDFDFEGSSLRGVEVFYRRWGAKAVPVWRIEKSGSIRGALTQMFIRRRDADRCKPESKSVS